MRVRPRLAHLLPSRQIVAGAGCLVPPMFKVRAKTVAANGAG